MFLVEKNVCKFTFSEETHSKWVVYAQRIQEQCYNTLHCAHTTHSVLKPEEQLHVEYGTITLHVTRQ